MNDSSIFRRDRTKNIKTLLRLFPYLKNKMEVSRLKIDDESLHYISVREVADKISDIIAKHLIKLNINPDTAIITDATAGVGGNSISFGMRFGKCLAVEIDRIRSEYLKNNTDIYNLKNVVVINDDCTKALPKIEDHNVVFIDPPWGGKFYKDHSLLRLKIGDISLEHLCNTILNKDIMKKTADLIVVKLPINYDIKHFYYGVNSNQIYFYNLKKMYIMVVVNRDLLET